MHLQWIERADGLPKDGQLCLIQLNHTHVFFHDENLTEQVWDYAVARFWMNCDDPFSEDVVPYCWSAGHIMYHSQYVDRWAALPPGAKRATARN